MGHRQPLFISGTCRFILRPGLVLGSTVPHSPAMVIP
jgi:hypothetical protein